jgi:prepilin-type N-terminal cleavage/methylation domain-containing protein
MPNTPTRRSPAPTGFTLVEVLVTIMLLAVATTLVIPSMGSTDVLRVQAAVRQTVSDITFAQTDAMAFQQRRAIWFNRVPEEPDVEPWVFTVGNGYTIAEVSGPILDLGAAALYHPDEPDQPFHRNFDNGDFGSARFETADFDGDELLIFDELGGPVLSLTGEDASNGGEVRIIGGASTRWAYDITIAPMTGRVTVDRTQLPN